MWIGGLCLSETKRSGKSKILKQVLLFCSTSVRRNIFIKKIVFIILIHLLKVSSTMKTQVPSIVAMHNVLCTRTHVLVVVCHGWLVPFVGPFCFNTVSCVCHIFYIHINSCLSMYSYNKFWLRSEDIRGMPIWTLYNIFIK